MCFFEQCLHILKQLSDEREEFYAWELLRVERESQQALFEKEDECSLLAHQQRAVHETSYQLEVLTRKGESQGKAALALSPFADIQEQVQEALQMALANQNPPWDVLQKPAEDYAKVQTADPQIMENPAKVLEELSQKVQNCVQNHSNVRVSTAELYVNASTVYRQTSTGIVTEKQRSDIYFESAIEQRKDFTDQEVNNVCTSVSVSDFKLEEHFEQSVQEVSSLGHTVEPQTTDSAVILVDGEAIAQFLLAVESQLCVSQEYFDLPFLKPGDALYRGNIYKGSPITLYLDPFIPAMVASTPYTASGFPAQKAMLVDQGIVHKQIVDWRFGQYLNRSVNGVCGNAVLEPGEHSIEELKAMEPNTLEVVKFSSLLVDSQKWTWSSEIKLAILHKADGSKQMIKGGVVSGHVLENFSDCLLSKDEETVNFPGNSFNSSLGYVGPKRMLIRQGVSIVGQSDE